MRSAFVAALACSLAAASAGHALAAGAPGGAWLLSDLHVHSDHSSDGSGPRQVSDDQLPGNVSVADQIGIANLAGLDWLALTDHRTYDQHYDPLWESDQLLLVPGEEANGSPHATVHGAVDTIVQGANPPGAPGWRRLQQSIWDAHSQGAVWVTAHPDDGEMNADGSPNENASAVGVDLVETWNRGSDVDLEMAYAEGRWNAGFRFGLSGGSDNHFRETWALQGPGSPTLSAFAARKNERAILQALWAGRTLVARNTLAPGVTLEADFDGDGVYEAIAGDEVTARAGTPGRLRIVVARGAGTEVSLYKSPGRSAGPLATFAPQSPELTAIYTVNVTADAAPSWYRVEVRGTGDPATYNTSDIPISIVPDPATLPDQLRAATSPIFVAQARVHAAGEQPLPADAGAADGAVAIFGSAGAFAGFPDVAAAVNATHLVAEVHEADATTVQYRRRMANGSWRPRVTLSDTSSTARFPKVAARGGMVWVVWQDETAGQVPRRPAIRLRQSADGGLTWGDTQTVRAIAGRCEHPDIAVTSDKLPLIVWQEIASGRSFDVMAQVLGRDAAPVNLSGAGKTVQAATPEDTRSARYPASVWPTVAIAPDGRLAVGWQDNRSDIDPLWTGATTQGEGTDPDNWQILLRTRAPGASEWSALAALGADDRADRHPALAFAADGTLVAAWDSKELRSSGANLAVLSAQSADGGATWTGASEIAGDPHAMGQYPKLGRDASGRVQAVWYDSRSADWRWRVMRATLTLAGWSDAQLLGGRGNNTWPAIDGGIVVMASTRNARRLQRDRTQQIFLLAP